MEATLKDSVKEIKTNQAEINDSLNGRINDLKTQMSEDVELKVKDLQDRIVELDKSLAETVKNQSVNERYDDAQLREELRRDFGTKVEDVYIRAQELDTGLNREISKLAAGLQELRDNLAIVEEKRISSTQELNHSDKKIELPGSEQLATISNDSFEQLMNLTNEKLETLTARIDASEKMQISEIARLDQALRNSQSRHIQKTTASPQEQMFDVEKPRVRQVLKDFFEHK